MSRRCKTGQRAKIVVECKNKGAIVMIVGPYHHGQDWDGTKNWLPCIFPWKTVCLSGPVRIIEAATGKFLRDSLYCVFEDSDLEPLDDDDDGLTRSTEEDKPIVKRTNDHTTV
jgi:hypothetical protein